jgi:two-component system sensor histidine kinase BaeS
MRSLRARATLVTVAVSVIAVLLTGLISLQLVRSSLNDEARNQLAAQADVLSQRPGLVDNALDGTLTAVVTDGVATGAAAEYVDKVILARLAEGQSVSTSRRGVLIEARPTAEGAVVLVEPSTTVERALGKATSRILIALAIGLAIAVLGGTLLARRLSSPLTVTAGAARRLAAGERGVPVPATTTTEIADVAAALSALDSALVTSEARQREFLLSISHELRTPLTAVRGYAEALADGLVADPAYVGRTLVAETERLDAFVRDLLELARLEADDFSITLADIDLATLAAEVAAAWSGTGTIVTTGAGTARTDARRLRQVLDGLVENALRSGASTVTLKVSPTAISVADDGPGLDPSHLAIAFERGALHARYREARAVGTGLGLSIAARLVARVGGKMRVESGAESGAGFTVELPRASA